MHRVSCHCSDASEKGGTNCTCLFDPDTGANMRTADEQVEMASMKLHWSTTGLNWWKRCTRDWGDIWHLLCLQAWIRKLKETYGGFSCSTQRDATNTSLSCALQGLHHTVNTECYVGNNASLEKKLVGCHYELITFWNLVMYVYLQFNPISTNTAISSFLHYGQNALRYGTLQFRAPLYFRGHKHSEFMRK